MVRPEGRADRRRREPARKRAGADPRPRARPRHKLPVSQGRRVELARYDTPTGPRRIIGQRRYDIPHLFDEPTTQIEPVIELGAPRTKAELEQILANHLNSRR